MDVSLTREETDTLARILPGYLADLRVEIRNTDRFQMRQNLKVEAEIVGRILARLGRTEETLAS